MVFNINSSLILLSFFLILVPRKIRTDTPTKTIDFLSSDVSPEAAAALSSSSNSEENITEDFDSTDDDIIEEVPGVLLGVDHLQFDHPFIKTYTSCKRGTCETCQVCVDNECLPYILESVYSSNCAVRDRCEEDPCGELDCVPSFGDYFCRCPPRSYGKHCEHVVDDDQPEVPFSGLSAVYPPAVAAGSVAVIMAWWTQREPLSRTQRLHYRTDDQLGFVDELTMDTYRITNQVSPRDRCLRHLVFRQTNDSCDFLPADMHSVTALRTVYPYLEFGQSQPQQQKNESRRVHRVLPGDRMVIGYMLTFSLTLSSTISSFNITTRHELFVYYSEPQVFFNRCFPKRIYPFPPCMTSLDYVEDNNVLIRNQLVLKTDVPAMDDPECRMVQLTYTIWRYENFLEGKAAEYNRSVDVAAISPYTLKGGDFLVMISALSSWRANRSEVYASNFITCWFRVRSTPLVAAIAGGESRTVYAYEDLVMDASDSLDPNSPPTRQTNLFFVWTCNGTESFCEGYTSKARHYVIKAPLPVGVTYLFTLKVYAFMQEPVFYQQRVTTTGVKFASFFIVCSKNCNPQVNSEKLTYLKIEVSGEESTRDRFNWTMSADDEVERSLARLVTSRTSYDVTILKAGALRPNTAYTFHVQRNNPVGYAKLLVRTCRKPKLVCTIKPSHGVQLETKFAIDCVSESSEALNYTVLTEGPDTSDDALPLYLSVNQTGRVKDLRLLYESVYVMAVTDSGCSEVMLYNVKLYSQNSEDLNVERMRQQILFWKDQVQNDTQLLWESPFGGYLNMLVYFSLFADTHNMDPVFKWEDLLDVVNKVDFHSAVHVKRLISVLTHLILLNSMPHMDDDYDSHIMNIILLISKMLKSYRMYKKVWNTDIQLTYTEERQIAKSLFNCINHMLVVMGEAENCNMRFKLFARDLSADAVIRCSLHHQHNHSEHEAEREMFSNLLLQYRYKLQSSLYKQMVDTMAVVSECFDALAEALLRRLLPMEPAVFLLSANNSLYIRMDSPKYFSLHERIPIIKIALSYIKISKRLSEELQQRSHFIKLKVLVLDADPFWWDDDTTDISTQIVHSMIAQNNGKTWIRREAFYHPLDIFLKVKSSQNLTVRGTMHSPAPELSDSDKDYSVTVYRLMSSLMGGHGKLFVRFDIPAGQQFRVALSNDFRPDYKYVTYNGLVLTNNTPEISHSYEMGDQFMFLYMGILPGRKVPPREVVELSFTAYVVQCLIRLNAMWISERCQVGNDTSQEMVHCACHYIQSLVGATISPPHVIPVPLVQVRFSRDEPFNVIPCIALAVLVAATVCFGLRAFYMDRYKYLGDKVVVLEDNFPGEEWAYLVGMYTGTRWEAGTSSRIGIKLIGELSDSRAHILRSSHYKVLSTYSDCWFLLFTTEHLGAIQSIHVWLDYKGSSPSWYCRKIIVYDFSAELKYVFRLGLWFYVGVNSDLVEAKVKPQSHGKTPLRQLLVDNLIFGFQEMHYVVCILKHHPRSFLSCKESVAASSSAFLLAVLIALIVFKYDNGGTEDYPFYHLRWVDFFVTLAVPIPAVAMSSACQLLFKHKVVTNHMKTWKLNCKESDRIVEKDMTEGKEKDGSPTVVETENVNKNIVLQKLKSVKRRYSCLQVPLTIKHEFADRIKIDKKRLFNAWVLVTTLFVSLCVLILLFGHNMEHTKSLVWITAIVIMLVNFPVFYLLSVVLQMLYVTYWEKMVCDEPSLACDPRLGTRLDVLGDRQYLDSLLARRSQPEYHPLRADRVQELREQYGHRLFRSAALDTVLSAVVFLVVFCNLLNGWTGDYHVTRHLTNIISSGVVNPDVTLQGVSDLNSLSTYLKDTVSHLFYKKQWYNGRLLDYPGAKFAATGWTVDYTSRLVGSAQLLLKRVTPTKCVPHDLIRLLGHPLCFGRLDEWTESRDDYKMGWTATVKEMSSSVFQNPWRYRAGQSASLIHYGQSGQRYSPGGYVIYLGRTLAEARAIGWKLQESGWINIKTRVLFVDSCIYNPNIDKIATISICFEANPTGSMSIKVQILTSSARFSYFSLQVAVLLVVAIIFLVLLFKVSISVNKQGLLYFTSIWNILDVFIVILFGLNYIINWVNILHPGFTLPFHLNTTGEGYFGYSWSGYYTGSFILFHCFLNIFCAIRLFKHFVQTFHVIPFMATLLSTGPVVIPLSVLVLPLLYLESNVIESLLFNSRLVTGTICLTNKVGLYNFAHHFQFPDERFVPYLYCQFCSGLIVVFGIIIAHHYVLAKYNTRIISGTVDVIKHLQDNIRKRKERNCSRLRGGADQSAVMLPDRDAICLLAIQELLRQPPIRQQATSLKPMKNLVNLKIKQDKMEQESRQKISTLLKNLDEKLDKIVDSLTDLHISL